MTEDQKKLADEIISFFKKNNGGSFRMQKINEAILHKNINGDSKLIPILAILVHNKILIFQPKQLSSAGMVIEHESYILSDKGWTYETYDKLLQDKKRKADLEEALITSSIASNISIKYVNRLFWVTAAFAFFSSVGTVGSFILELHRGVQKPSQETSTSYSDTTQKNKVTLSVFDSLKKKQSHFIKY